MRNDERFEIQRAFDLLPHVVGASWTAVWFRMQGIRKPLREEFREKALEYLKMIVKMVLCWTVYQELLFRQNNLMP